MSPARRLPWPLIVVALVLAILVSGGAILLVVVPWLLYLARDRDQLRGCLFTGCAVYAGLSLAIGLALLRAGQP